MKIALFGASGTIGQQISHEALARGFDVKALVRNTDSSPCMDCDSACAS